jgi:hypothetical protein
MVGWFKRRRRVTERDVLTALYYEVLAMALNFDKLNAALARSAVASEKLLAAYEKAQPDPAVEVASQAAIDNAASALDTKSARVEGVLPPEEKPVEEAVAGQG